MDIDALRSFLAFIETGSFTRAAKQVHRTQAAVSMQMKKLEEDVGKCLFEKQGRLLTLSQDGRQFSHYAKQLLQLHDETLQTMRQSASNTLLRLGCPDDYADNLLPVLIKQLHAQFCNLDLRVTCLPSFKIKQLLDAGDLDLGLITRSPDSEEGHLIYQDKGVWVYNPEHSAHLKSPLPIAVFQPDCRFHQGAIEGLMKAKIPFQVVASCSSIAALLGLVKQGAAVGAIAKISTADYSMLSNAELPTLPGANVALIRSQSLRNPISQEIYEQLSQTMRTFAVNISN